MKADLVFGLENAGWPALLIDGSGTICRANDAAIKLFGPALEGGSTKLSALWSTENSVGADQFLPQWERAPLPTAQLKFRGKGGNTLAQLTSICSITRDGQKYFVMQLLLEPAAQLAPPGKSASGDTTTLVHKQKLDCALQLARTVALDFNNALTSILGHTSLVLSQMEPNNTFRPSLLEVEKSAARAAEIANDLGTFSRQEKEAKSQAAGNLNLLLERTVEYFHQRPGVAPIDWKLVLERKLFAARFDEAKMQQALMKIVENAVESFTGFGRITLQTHNVELADRAQDQNVRLAAGAYVCAEITDNGCGIPSSVLPRIFEPFFTTKQRPHRGVGLAYVYGIVTNHGGGVAVSSQPGNGTSVRVYLPAEQRLVKENGSIADGDLKGTQTVLIVDDEEILLSMGQKILTTYGYKVLTANSGQKAIEILSKKDSRVDLVVTDLVMPTMGGRELVERIQRLAPQTRIVCTSGYVLPAEQEDEDAYLQKPFTAQELLLKVKRALATE
jgi:signal transduction histidine kinase